MISTQLSSRVLHWFSNAYELWWFSTNMFIFYSPISTMFWKTVKSKNFHSVRSRFDSADDMFFQITGKQQLADVNGTCNFRSNGPIFLMARVTRKRTFHLNKGMSDHRLIYPIAWCKSSFMTWCGQTYVTCVKFQTRRHKIYIPSFALYWKSRHRIQSFRFSRYIRRSLFFVSTS